MTHPAKVQAELIGFQFMTNALFERGLPIMRAELWARACVDRYRHGLRRGIDRSQLFTAAHADRLAKLDALGCDPRNWI